MKKKENGKRKLSLILSTCLSLTAVFTGGVSTFAWFQAYGNANIRTTESSTDVSVSAPDAITVTSQLYYCVENGYELSRKGYSGNPALTFDEDDDDSADTTDSFIPVTQAEQKSLSGIFPGYKMTFMIKVSADTDLGEVGLDMLDLTPARAGRASSVEQPLMPRNEYGDSYITLANAIRISVFTIDDEGDFVSSSVTSGSNVFTYESGTQNYSLKAKGGDFGSNVFVFYTVYFDDTPSDVGKTTYLEYTNSDYDALYVGSTPTAGPRYFKQSAQGDSNAYEGLTFTIKTLKVTVG